MNIFHCRPIAIFAAVCAAALSGHAQSSTPDDFHQSLTAAFVYEVKAGPNHGSSYPSLNNAPGFSISYGFRPRPWLLLEAGLDQIVRSIGSSVCCEYSQNAEDQLFLIPFGARYVWAPRGSRLRLTGGGGGAYLDHTIGNQAGGTVGFYGFGGQFVASGDYAATRSGRLRVGVTARYYFASPKPSENLGIPGFTQRGALHIFVIGPEVTFSFH